jgi:hypothetical protein
MTGRGEWDYSVDRGDVIIKKHLHLYISQQRFPELLLGLLVVHSTHCRFLQLMLFMRRLMSSEKVEFLEFLCPINANPGKFRVLWWKR